MKKIALIGMLFITACNNNKPMLNSLDVARIDSESIAEGWLAIHPQNDVVKPDTNNKKFFYEYVEILNKGERGIFKSNSSNLHKGDHISLDIISNDKEEKGNIVVEITTEAKELKKK